MIFSDTGLQITHDTALEGRQCFKTSINYTAKRATIYTVILHRNMIHLEADFWFVQKILLSAFAGLNTNISSFSFSIVPSLTVCNSRSSSPHFHTFLAIFTLRTVLHSCSLIVASSGIRVTCHIPKMSPNYLICDRRNEIFSIHYDHNCIMSYTFTYFQFTQKHTYTHIALA